MSNPPLNHAATDYIERLTDGLAKLGKRPENVTLFDLAPADQLHVRGKEAVEELIAAAEIPASAHVADFGAGLGGPARLLAHTTGCRVTGYDVNGLSVAAGNLMSEWVGLRDKVELVESDVVGVPAGNNQFDIGITIHVAMFIPDKAAFYAEAARIIKPGGKFVIYDPVRVGEGERAYPMPWSYSQESDGSLTEPQLLAYLHEAGFAIEHIHHKKEACLAWMARMAQAAKQRSGPPPIGIHLLGGGIGGNIIRSVNQNLKSNLLDFVEIHAVKR